MNDKNNPSDAEKEAAAQAAAEAAEKEAAEKSAAEAAEQEAAAKAAKKADKQSADAPKAKTPAWQLPDYAGPLDINQAQWRLRNVKPVAEPRKK